MIQCPHCTNDYPDLLEPVSIYNWYCKCCAKIFEVTDEDIDESANGNKAVDAEGAKSERTGRSTSRPSDRHSS